MVAMRPLQSFFRATLAPAGLTTKCRHFTMSAVINDRHKLQQEYEHNKILWAGKKLPEDVNPKNVFASNELDLSEIKVYGFDYDYTLANYEPAVEHLIYQLGKNILVSKYRYPDEIKNLKYDKDFAVRGLHYDIEKGLLMKIDQFQQIQMGSVYSGMTPLSEKEVLEIYGKRALPLDYVEGHLRGTPKMAHLADCFSMPEMCLLSQVVQYFKDNDLLYDTVSIFNDVKSAIGSIHPEMHRIVGRNISEYLIKDAGLVTFFERLRNSGKEMFLITNSPFYFVNAGMTYILGENWRDYFDVVVANAKKPNFFVINRPFRELNEEIDTQTWGPVNTLEKGKVYLEGNLNHLQKSKCWQGQQVLYFGDHPYSDLADVSLNHGWRTGAIIWELDYEIQCLNHEEYKKISGWLMVLQTLIESSQDAEDEGCRQLIKEWEKERDDLRKRTKVLFNQFFGSVFRTHDNPTYFSRRLFRFADIYTSQLVNLTNYSINHTYYPRRGVLPHEYKSFFV
ncbi:unnamed protein product [Meganyctiphanes norvegica]|uniref:5'-nucleotidase domain-containing protein 3 n=1 Tax=Meganyctiphanes norvegica TaxID=48144 RepID=A0AAV2REG7_MEGNR